MFAGVIIDIDSNQVNKIFDYKIPLYFESVVEVGTRVIVPFGSTKRTGFVVKISNESLYDSKKLKSIIDIVDIEKPLNEEFIDLAFYLSNHDFAFYISYLNAMIPSALNVKYKKKVVLLNKDICDKELLELFSSKDYFYINDSMKEKLKLIKDGINNKSILITNDIVKHNYDKKIRYIKVLNELYVPKSKKGKELLKYLIEAKEPVLYSHIISDMGYSSSVIKTLILNGCLENFYMDTYRKIDKLVLEDKKVILTKPQEEVIDSVTKAFNSNEIFLLNGITGSGKTNVYLEIIEKCIEKNLEALLLVPEIALTPQMTGIISLRFKDKVAVLHSRLTIGEKYDEWKKILHGDVKIAVGARSAIFAPFKHLGVIIIDEEHENSYKQDTFPKYDAITVAIKRANYHNCPLVLGSATPRVTDYYKALENTYHLLELNTRPNNLTLPKTTVVDMRDELKKGNRSVFSYQLQKKLVETYKKGEQSILFLNRRGYSSFVMCRDCGYVVSCPHCDSSLTHHKNSNKLVCHHCGYEIESPVTCPNCNSTRIRFVGSGTEKIFEEINSLIPEAKVLRMDADTTKELDSYQTIYQAVKNKEVDILVGTQMIAKGLDFPNVTLVGIVNADLALKYPRYDANEVCFDLIEQTSGRAGRSISESNVIIQTYNPNNFVIECSSKHDYKGFYDEEIKRRNLAMLPPFSELVTIMISSKAKDLSYSEALYVKKYIESKDSKSILLGPCTDSMFKLNDMYRYIVTLKVLDDMAYQALNELISIFQNKKDTYISITRM